MTGGGQPRKGGAGGSPERHLSQGRETLVQTDLEPMLFESGRFPNLGAWVALQDQLPFLADVRGGRPGTADALDG